MEDYDEDAISCKVVLLGEAGVGKGEIIVRFMGYTTEEMEMSSSHSSKTVTFKEYDGKSIKFDIWDIVGTEKNRSLAKIFYKDADVAILVYDITRKGSFEDLQNYWIEEIRQNARKNISKLK